MTSFWTRAAAVLSTTIFVSACDPYARTSTAIPIPALDPRDEAPCEDASVDGGAVQIAAQARLALAICRGKHQNVVEQYNDVRDRFGVQ